MMALPNLQKPYLPALFLIAFTFLSFLPSLSNGWVDWDDPTYVLQNELVTSDQIQWSAIFQKDQVLGIYHPITLLSYAFDYQCWGTDAFGYHLTNILLHAVSSAFVFLVFLRLGSSTFVAVAVALFFGIHPMHVESVAWISERKDVLYVFFLLLSWLSYLHYRSIQLSKRWLWYAMMLVLFALSILSKPIAFVFPAILLLSDFLQDYKFSFAQVWDKIPLGALALVAIFIAQSGQAASDSLALSSDHPVPTFFYGCYNLVFYLFKSVVPIQLSTFHPFPTDASMNWMFYGALPLVAVYFWGIYWSYKHHKKVFFGLLFFTLTIAPLLQIIPFGKTLSSERYTYLSYIGIFYVFALGLDFIRVHFHEQRRLIGAGLLGILSFFLIQNKQQQNQWKDSLTLWQNAVDQHPSAYFPHLALGRTLVSSGKTQKALKHFNKSISLYPNAEAYYERGLFFEHEGETEKALEDYKNATLGKIPYPKARVNAARLLMKQDHIDLAKLQLLDAIVEDPEYSLAYYNLAVIVKVQRRPKIALNHIQHAVQLEPKNVQYIEMRAAILTDLRQHNAAIRDFKYVLKFNTNNKLAHYYTGLNYHLLNKKDKARSHFRSAAQLGYVLPSEIRKQYPINRE